MRRELSLLDSYAFTTGEIVELIEWVKAGKLGLSASISKRLSLEDVNQGPEDRHRKIEDPIRIVIMAD